MQIRGVQILAFRAPPSVDPAFHVMCRAELHTVKMSDRRLALRENVVTCSQLRDIFAHRALASHAPMIELLPIT